MERLSTPRANALNNLIKAGALDVLGDRGDQLTLAEAYFGTTSVRKRAELNWAGVRSAVGGATPREYLDWERELLGFYASAHPVSSITDEAIEAALAGAVEHERRSSRNNGKPARDIERYAVADCLAFNRVRDSELRFVVGMASDVAWKGNRSGNGGRLMGKLEDETGICRLIVWQPREADGRAARDAFAALRERVENNPSPLGLSVLGGFSFNERWDKLPGIVADRWWELALAVREVANHEPAPAPTIARPDPTRLADTPETLEGGLASIFG